MTGRSPSDSHSSRPWPVAAGVALALFAAALFLMFRLLSLSAGETPGNFSAIQVGRIVLVSASDGRTATLYVHTSIKAICAVAYGPTAPYGQLATDRAMDPSGHQDHAAFLTGLTPRTSYLYRLQGVGIDGRLYRSPVYSFQTPAATQQVDSRNVAIGASVLKVSSVFSPDFAAKYAVDGDPGTEWASQGDGNHAFITIKLRRTVRVIAVAFHTRSMGDGTAITKTYSVTVDGKKTYGPFRASPGSAVNRVAFTGQVIRFSVVQSTGGNTGASEVAVYGRP
jgi:hypothetical protein